MLDVAVDVSQAMAHGSSLCVARIYKRDNVKL